MSQSRLQFTQFPLSLNLIHSNNLYFQLNTISMNAKFIFRCTFLFSSFVSFGQIDTTDFDNRPIQEIEEVLISSNFKEIAFEDSKNYIIDFEVSELGYYVLLKHLRKYQLVKLDEQLNVITKMNLNFKPTQLFSDCLGSLHLLSKDSMYQLNTYSDNLSIFERNSIDLYHDFYKKCVGQSGDYVYMKEVNDFGQSQIFYAFNRNEGGKRLIYKIEDSLAVADVNQEYRGILSNSHLEAQRMQEINIAQLGGSRDHMERIFFFIQVLSRPAYNPLFVRNDTTHIFDHTNGLAIHLSSFGNLITQKSIDYHLQTNWKERNHLDPIKSKFYTEYKINGYQYLAPLSSREYEDGVKMEISDFTHSEKLIVYNGFVYYTYKENVDAHLNKPISAQIIGQKKPPEFDFERFVTA